MTSSSFQRFWVEYHGSYSVSRALPRTGLLCRNAREVSACHYENGTTKRLSQNSASRKSVHTSYSRLRLICANFRPRISVPNSPLLPSPARGEGFIPLPRRLGEAGGGQGPVGCVIPRFAGEPHQPRFSRPMRLTSITTSYAFAKVE